MKVVLFCGGLGTRLGGESNNVPKPMVKIGYRPILWHIMKYYAHYGHKDFILCLGYKADIIKEYFLNYNEFISCDFTMCNGTRKRTARQSDIADWNITFVDTGLKSNVGQRLKAVDSYLEGEDPPSPGLLLATVRPSQALRRVLKNHGVARLPLDSAAIGWTFFVHFIPS